MPKITIRLIGGKLGTHAVKVEYDDIAEASMVQYDDEFFLFKSITEPFWAPPTFEKCEPPLKVG